METKVKQLANSMADTYASRCSSNIISCDIKSFNQCDGTDTHQCYEQFPTPSSCSAEGAFLSTTSAIRFPNSVNTDNLSDEDRNFVCASATI